MSKLKRIRVNDLLAPIKFIIVLPIALLYKKIIKHKNKKIILIIEDPMEAVDNGYAYFKYLKSKNIPDCYYVLDKDSPHIYKFESYENSLVFFDSFKHWLYYLSATRNYMIHKAGSPNAALFYILHKYQILDNNRVFLQHGIIMNDLPYLYKKECHFKYFITSSPSESKFIKKKFGYDEEIIESGISRFDSLYHKSERENIIAIIPTWRKYLIDLDDDEFMKTDYYLSWMKLINNNKIKEITQGHDFQIVFYLHRNMQKFTNLFHSDFVDVVSRDNQDLTSLIYKSSILITDYSSILFDFSFQKKPSIYYQFDYHEFRKKHLNEGYFSYLKNGFGPVVSSIENLIDELIEIFDKDVRINELYEERVEKFFHRIDGNNCSRIYEETLAEEYR